MSTPSNNSQKFIKRNRSPRVQIEYDVETYGAEKRVELPFVMGVLGNFSGTPQPSQPSLSERSFLSIDVDNFDDRMKAIKPHLRVTVPNQLTHEGSLVTDLTFESINDFTPEAIAHKIPALKVLLEARIQLSNLMTYMDGKEKAEELITRLLKNPTLLEALSQTPEPTIPSLPESHD